MNIWKTEKIHGKLKVMNEKMIRPKLNDGMLPGMCHLHATSFNAVKYGINLQKWHVAAAALLLLYIHDSRALI